MRSNSRRRKDQQNKRKKRAKQASGKPKWKKSPHTLEA